MQPPLPIFNLFPLIFIFIIFYFLLIRPQQKRQKDHETLIASLKKNDEVVTTGGIHGTIINVKEKTFILRVDENVKLEINKGSITYVTKRQ